MIEGLCILSGFATFAIMMFCYGKISTLSFVGIAFFFVFALFGPFGFFLIALPTLGSYLCSEKKP